MVFGRVLAFGRESWCMGRGGISPAVSGGDGGTWGRASLGLSRARGGGGADAGANEVGGGACARERYGA